MKRVHLYVPYFAIFIGAFFIIYYLGNAFVSGFISFSIIFFILGLLLCSYSYFELKYHVNVIKKLPRYIQIMLLFIIAVGSILFTIVEVRMIYIGQQQDTNPSDVIIVLGAGLMGDELSASLRYRLESTIEYHTLHPEVPILVTGGQGYGETRTEASAMKEYLLMHGVDNSLIYVEDISTNTYENFFYGKQVLEHKNITVQTATVITNNFHMMRAIYLGELQGFEIQPYSADTYLPQILNDYVREFFACIKAFILYA